MLASLSLCGLLIVQSAVVLPNLSKQEAPETVYGRSRTIAMMNDEGHTRNGFSPESRVLAATSAIAVPSVPRVEGIDAATAAPQTPMSVPGKPSKSKHHGHHLRNIIIIVAIGVMLPIVLVVVADR